MLHHERTDKLVEQTLKQSRSYLEKRLNGRKMSKRKKYGGRKKGTPNKQHGLYYNYEPLVNYDNVSGIYIVRSFDRYKIGYASNMYRRISQLNTANAFGVTTVRLLPMDLDVAKLGEQMLHKSLKGFRVHGEWFELDNTHLQILHQLTIFDLGG